MPETLEPPSYRWRLCLTVFSELRGYWTRYQILVFITSPVLETVWQTAKAQANWKSLPSLMLGIILHSIIVFLSILGITALYALARSPALVDKKSREQIAELNAVLMQQTSVQKISPQEIRRREWVCSCLTIYTREEKLVLRHILDQGKVNTMLLGTLELFRHQAISGALTKASSQGSIVVDTHNASIKAELSVALGFVLDSDPGL